MEFRNPREVLQGHKINNPLRIVGDEVLVGIFELEGLVYALEMTRQDYHYYRERYDFLRFYATSSDQVYEKEPQGIPIELLKARGLL